MAREWYIGGEVAELIDWTPFDDEESDDPLGANNKKNKSVSDLANKEEHPQKKENRKSIGNRSN